ncbi:MAG TPA: energy transducer TonB [Pyrinomonadaceae bacterium]|jgi:TonB family protein
MYINLLKRIVPFVVTLSLGLITGSFISNESNFRINNRSDNGFCRAKKKAEIQTSINQNVIPLKIKSQPRPKYTEAARKNNVSGTVRLLVTFSASGKVTEVKRISGLPDGLTEEAIIAAKNIEFEPPQQNGKPISIVKPVEYKFSIY